MRHLNLHDNLSVIGAAADDFFFLLVARFRGPFGLVTCHAPKGYFKVRYFFHKLSKIVESYIEDNLLFKGSLFYY
jgi:hypothetical protein